MHVGKKIRELRRQRKRSQRDLARELGISVPSYSKIETGITDVNLSRLEQIAQLFGITVSEMLHEGQDRDIPASLAERFKILEEELRELRAEVAAVRAKLAKLARAS